MQIGEVAIANGAHVRVDRTAGTTGYFHVFTIWQSVAIMRVKLQIQSHLYMWLLDAHNYWKRAKCL